MRKFSFSAALLSCYFVVLFFLPSPVYGQVPQEWNKLLGGNRCTKTLNGVEAATVQGIECIFINITRILVPIAGIAMFIMLIVGALQLITASGDAKALQKARLTITNAVVGLVLFLGIWFILQLIKTISGVDVTIFKIPGP